MSACALRDEELGEEQVELSATEIHATKKEIEAAKRELRFVRRNTVNKLRQTMEKLKRFLESRGSRTVCDAFVIGTSFRNAGGNKDNKLSVLCSSWGRGKTNRTNSGRKIWERSWRTSTAYQGAFKGKNKRATVNDWFRCRYARFRRLKEFNLENSPRVLTWILIWLILKQRKEDKTRQEDKTRRGKDNSSQGIGKKRTRGEVTVERTGI